MIARFCFILCGFFALIGDAISMRYTICLENRSGIDFSVDTSRVLKSDVMTRETVNKKLIIIQPQKQANPDESSDCDEILVKFSRIGENQNIEQVAIRWKLEGMVTRFELYSSDVDFPICMQYSTSNGPLIMCVFQERDKLSQHSRDNLIKKLLKDNSCTPESLAIQTGIETDKARELIRNYKSI